MGTLLTGHFVEVREMLPASKVDNLIILRKEEELASYNNHERDRTKIYTMPGMQKAMNVLPQKQNTSIGNQCCSQLK